MQVTFFPRKDLEAKICDYRHGKRFAVQMNTDAALNIYTPFQLFQAFKYGIKYTLFSNRYNPGGSNSIANIDYVHNCGTGLVELQHYFNTDRWINPTTGIDELIPDHSVDVWSSLGANAFGMTIGEPKVKYYPNHGQELYNISNGAYGYDVVNGVIGASNLSEFIGIKTKHNEWTNSLEVPKSTTFSYRNGKNTTPDIYKMIYVGGRNSGKDPSFFYYGKSKVDGEPLGNNLPLSRSSQINQTETTRWVDAAISTNPNPIPTANQLIRNAVNSAYATRGQYGDFSHFHNAGNNQVLENLFKTLGEHLDSTGYRNECWIAGYGELSEYFWFRELTKRAVATTLGEKVYITLQWEDLKTVQNGISNGLLLDALKTPLSIEVDLTGTILSGKNVKSTGGKILKKGNNKYLVDFPFRDAVEGIKSVVLYEGEGEFYPTSTANVSISQISNQIKVTSNIPVNMVLFRHLLSEDYYKISSVDFNNKLVKEALFNVELGYKYYLGVVNELNQTELIEI